MKQNIYTYLEYLHFIGLLEISDNTTVHLLEIIGKELPKDVSKDNRLNENWIPTVKDLREVTTPDSWIKWHLLMKLAEELRSRIHSEKGICVLVILFIFSILSSIFFLFNRFDPIFLFHSLFIS